MKKNLLKKIISIALIASSFCMPVQASWIKTASGKWNWTTTKGSKAVGWKYINNKWYYFNSNGEMRTGWLEENGKKYCFSDSGAMFTGWVCYSKKWYYMNGNGEVQKGWLKYNGKDYYLGQDGVMQTGTIIIDNKSYTFNNSGALTGSSSSIASGSTVNSSISNNGTQLKEPTVNLKPVTDPNIFNNSGQQVTIAESSNQNNSTTNNSSNTETNDDSGSDELKDFSYDDMNLKDEALGSSQIRTEAPAEDNKFYYSDLNLFYKVKLSPPFSSGDNKINGNCTWYSWGRIFELTGKAPNDAGFNGNAYQWWDANKQKGKFKYGTEPKVGALAVWKPALPGSGGCGHVAIVEKIENNKIYISESSWHGSLFNYREIYCTDYLYGYIYIDEPNS